MQVVTETIRVSTKGHTDICDLTKQVEEKLRKTGLQNGTVTVFIPGSTAGISTIEYEPGLQKDLPEMFEKFAPMKADYHHHETWGDHNGSAHCRAPLVGPSLTVPIVNGRMTLGTWQQIVLFDFDDTSRNREIICQFMGV